MLAMMRRYLVALLVLAIGVAAGAAAYTVVAAEREYERLVAVGDAALAQDRPFEALEAYGAAIRLRPDSMLPHLKRGIISHDRGDFETALTDLRRAADLDPTATLALESLGDTYLALQRPDRAAERYAAYVVLDDRSARGWYKLGLARYRAGQLTSARESAERAVALDRSLAEAHVLLGLCLRDEGRLDQARVALETAVTLAPALTTPREALADVYRARGETARALDQLEALAALESHRPERFVALGLAYARARRHEAAVLTLGRAVERFPDEPRVYAALGRVWLDHAETTGDAIALKKALQALTTATGQAEAASDVLTDLGRTWLLMGDAAAAQRTLRQAVARLPVRPEAHRYLAALAARGGRTQEARDHLIRYATLVGDRQPMATVAAEIAAYSIRLGEPGLARRWIDRAMDEAGVTPVLAALRRRAEAAEREPR
jgi:tetratricopeptide (TPR) repeat protein